MKDRIRITLEFLAARLSEQSTWQGIGFIVSLTSARFGVGLDWGQAAGIGGIVSALLKMVFPDPVKP